MLASFGALALRCTEAAPEARPLMTDVVVSLEGMLAGGGQAGGAAHPSPEALLLHVNECRICMDEPRATAFMPCRHSVACAPCAQLLLGRPCPICRAHVASVVPADGADTYVPPAGPSRPPFPAVSSVVSATTNLTVASPSLGAMLTWPKHVRVSPGPEEGGGGPELVSFPPRDAAGGASASLEVRDHSTIIGGLIGYFIKFHLSRWPIRFNQILSVSQLAVRSNQLMLQRSLRSARGQYFCRVTTYGSPMQSSYIN